jgi:error-prone DNA polymerase
MSSPALLHVHSSSSPLWGVHTPAKVVRQAGALGYGKVALTDRNGLYGLFYFLEAAGEESMTPIVAAEVEAKGERALLWVRDSRGYSSLCRILSERHCDPSFSLGKSLSSHRTGLIIATDCEQLAARLASEERRGLYVELSPGHRVHELLKFARERRIPPVATTRAVGFGPEDIALHRVLRAVALSTKLSRLPESETARQWDYLVTPARLADHFPHCPDAIDNIEVIADACAFTGPDTSTVLPVFKGLDAKGALSLLRGKAYDGARCRYGAITPAVEARLEKELALIAGKGFASYFLVVEDIVKRSPRTCGRGSAAASIVAYALGITHVDPIKHNLFFERFLNPGRVDPPDIDVDFPWDERDGLLDAVFAIYGARRVAMVANQVGFKYRAALREVAKVYGMPDAEISRMQKLLSGRRRAGVGSGGPGDPVSRPPWPEIMEISARLSGHLRHLSVHCGGVVIAPEDVRNHAVVEVSAKGVPIIQWEKEQCEASGLVKIDLLGNRSLAVIRDVLDVIKKSGRTPIDYSTWKPDLDPATLDTVRRGETMGCFYVESPATRLLLKKMWSSPQCREKDVYEHLVMASSIIRPAANRFIRLFVARMQGEKWDPMHPLLDGVLSETYGVAIYQEQVTQIAMALAGFTAVEGDRLRKVMAKKDPTRQLADIAGKFMEGALNRGVSRETVEEAWSQILSFSGYSFCKPHSASYALVSMKCAYLKTHFPAEFMAAVLANHGGYYSPFAYISECRRMALKVAGPSVNESAAPCTGHIDTVRIGLGEIKGLSAAGVGAVLEARGKGGPFGSLQDLLDRTRIAHEDARILARAGALDELDPDGNRAALLYGIDRLAGRAKTERGKGLFAEPVREEEAPGFVPIPHEKGTLRLMEWEALGFPVSFHPLSPFAPAIHRERARKGPPLIPGRDLARYPGRRVRLVGWRITAKPVATKDGDPMEFVSFEDTTAIFETVLFPEVYAKVWSKLSSTRPFLLEGVVEMEFGVPTLTVEKLEPLEG